MSYTTMPLYFTTEQNPENTTHHEIARMACTTSSKGCYTTYRPHSFNYRVCVLRFRRNVFGVDVETAIDKSFLNPTRVIRCTLESDTATRFYRGLFLNLESIKKSHIATFNI